MALLLGSAAPAFGKDVLCAFQARGLSMNFGQLDPRSGLDATAVLSAATLNADMAGDCQQVAMNVDAAAGPRLLTSTTGSDAIPYTLVGLPVSPPAPGNNKYVKFTFGALILWSAYANAPAGNYQDTVIISVTP